MADDPQAELERLRAENERLKKAASRGGSIRVSEKGGVSIYGLGRFPVTLYKEQWTRPARHGGTRSARSSATTDDKAQGEGLIAAPERPAPDVRHGGAWPAPPGIGIATPP
jgi:hypothetical protein